MDVGCSPWGFGASTMTLQHHSGSAIPQLSKNSPLTCNSVRVHPYTHSQHIKVVKHFIFIIYGCGMQSTGVLEPQPWHYNIIRASPYPNFSYLVSIPRYLQCKGAPVGAPVCCKHAKFSSNWRIVGVIGSIEYEPEASKQPVMSQSLVSH